MDVVASVATNSSVGELRAVVRQLDRYAEWLDIVARAETVEAVEGDPGSAWMVDLRGQIGPLRRTKRLRMVRTVDDAALVRFERHELDGRQHSPWTLTAAIIDPDDRDDRDGGGTARPGGAGGAQLTMTLHYGGSLWVPILDRLLSDEIERSRTRLLAVLAG